MKYFNRSRIKPGVLLICAVLLLCAAGLALAEPEEYVIEYTTYPGGEHDVAVYDARTGRDVTGGYKLAGYITLSPTQFIVNPNGNTSIASPEVMKAYVASLRTWNAITKVNLLSESVRVSSSAKFGNNNVNTITFESITDNPSALARTTAYVRAYTGGNSNISKYVREVDIRVSPDRVFCDASVATGGYDLCSIITHELGHVLGLGDIYDANYSYVTMYGYFNKNDISPRTLDEADIYGIKLLYDVNEPFPEPTVAPTGMPTVTPTTGPTGAPTTAPTTAPTYGPTGAPTLAPTMAPTSAPTFAPTTAPTSAPTLAPTSGPTSAPTPTYSPTLYATVKTEGGRLSLRSLPNSTATRLTSIPNGTRLMVLSKGANWSYVQYFSYKGYASNDYLSFELVIPTSKPTATPSTKPTPSPTPSVLAYKTVTLASAAYLNMRTGPGVGYDIAAQIPNGTRVPVLADMITWYKVYYNGVTGYCDARYLK